MTEKKRRTKFRNTVRNQLEQKFRSYSVNRADFGRRVDQLIEEGIQLESVAGQIQNDFALPYDQTMDLLVAYLAEQALVESFGGRGIGGN